MSNGAWNAITSLAFIALLAGASWWLAPRQPQWVSRDGRRFITFACRVDAGQGAPGRWVRVHGRISGDRVSLRQSALSAGRLSGEWILTGVERDATHAVYTLGPRDPVLVRTRRDGALASLFDDMMRT
jgi:hypothetical protein